ncbi:MAG: response regulator [Magnetococcales bacterium]|nr:response regulator [Magnetococcales bacterium]
MKRILVIDDDPQFLAMTTLMLREGAYEVVPADSSEKALALLDHEGPWDLVLCDILMPEQDGIETILAIRRRDKNQKIIAMSGGGRYLHSNQVLLFSKDIGAQEALAKPFTSTELFRVVQLVLEEADASAGA